MAIGPGPTPGQDYIYIGDTGDNVRRRSSVTVYRVPEPLVNASQDPVTLSLNDVDAFPMQYPGTVYDSETLLVDPVSDDIFLVTRDREGAGAAYVFRNPSPHTPGVPVTLELVATIPLPLEVKGGDVSPSGDAVLLRPHSFSGYEDGYYWPRAAGTNLWDAFSGTSCVVPLIEEPQGEALGFAADGLGYYTIGEGSHQPIYFYENDTSTLLVPTGSTWRYLDDGSDPGAAWHQIDYDDSAWALGASQLGYGDGDEATVVSYGQDPDDKHITTYFRHTFRVENASVMESFRLNVLRDDGAVVYLNGTEIYRANMPEGAIQHETLAASTVWGNEESTFFPASVDTILLADGLNVLAVEVHQAAVTSSDISFDLELLGTGSPLATQVQIPMVPGWNLVSASLSPSATALTDALYSIEGKYDLVYSYDASDTPDPWKKHDAEGPPFTNDLTEIDGTMGLWIRVTEPVTLTVSGCVPPSTDVSLYTGWNLVACPLRAARPITQALSSIEGLCNLIYAYDASAYDASHTSDPWKKYDAAGPPVLNGLLEMQPGHGYWLRVSEDCTWRLVP
jgi:hypothetical protein